MNATLIAAVGSPGIDLPAGGWFISAHHGVRPVQQGEGDSFVVAFARASDAAACALQLQRAPLAPIRLRIGVHTGEIQLRDEGNYMGPTINRTARLRDLARRRADRAVGHHRGSGSRSAADRRRRPTRVRISCGIFRAGNGWCSCAIPTSPTTSRRCAHLKPLGPSTFQLSSRVSWAAKPKWTTYGRPWLATGW